MGEVRVTGAKEMAHAAPAGNRGMVFRKHMVAHNYCNSSILDVDTGRIRDSRPSFNIQGVLHQPRLH